jgi:hypothetical protein
MTSKKTIARNPMRPTTLKWPAPATPATSVEKIRGAMIMRIMRRNNWLNGLIHEAIRAAVGGSRRLMTRPAITPTARPMKI